MVALDWRVTIVSVLLLPVFLVPAKRVGPSAAAATPEEAWS